jgi:hypothetical protein
VANWTNEWVGKGVWLVDLMLSDIANNLDITLTLLLEMSHGSMHTNIQYIEEVGNCILRRLPTNNHLISI